MVSREKDVAKENDNSKRRMYQYTFSGCWTLAVCPQFRLWCFFSEKNDSIKENVPSKTDQNP